MKQFSATGMHPFPRDGEHMFFLSWIYRNDHDTDSREGQQKEVPICTSV